MGGKACVTFVLFYFWKILWGFKVAKSMNKNETNSKMHNFTQVFIETNFVLKSQIKLLEFAKENRMHFLNASFALREFLEHLSFISMYWINFQNKCTFTNQKLLLHAPFLLVFLNCRKPWIYPQAKLCYIRIYHVL